MDLELKNKISSLSVDKLEDIVKNYRQGLKKFSDQVKEYKISFKFMWKKKNNSMRYCNQIPL